MSYLRGSHRRRWKHQVGILKCRVEESQFKITINPVITLKKQQPTQFHLHNSLLLFSNGKNFGEWKEEEKSCVKVRKNYFFSSLRVHWNAQNCWREVNNNRRGFFGYMFWSLAQQQQKASVNGKKTKKIYAPMAGTINYILLEILRPTDLHAVSKRSFFLFVSSSFFAGKWLNVRILSHLAIAIRIMFSLVICNSIPVLEHKRKIIDVSLKQL